MVRLSSRLRGIAIWALASWLLLLSGSAVAQMPLRNGCQNRNSAELAALTHHFTRDEFRIFYTLEGPHALSAPVDANHNTVPDQVEDIVTQMVVARTLYSNGMGLTSPLQKPRYAAVRSIDVFLHKLSRANGRAYDEPVNYHLPFDGSEGRCVLRIDIETTLPARNVTPAHELFHLYQYGYAMFKAPWFLEGTAQWAQQALNARSRPQRSLPTTATALQHQVFSGNGGAPVLMWNRLATLTDPMSALAVPASIRQTRYVNGERVAQNPALNGAPFIKTTLEAFETLSAQIATRNGWSRFRWTERDQRATVHNRAMLDSIRAALQRVMRDRPHTAELTAFLYPGS